MLNEHGRVEEYSRSNDPEHDLQSMKPVQAETDALRAVSTVLPMTTSF